MATVAPRGLTSSDASSSADSDSAPPTEPSASRGSRLAYDSYADIPSDVKARYTIDIEQLREIDRSGCNQIGAWVTNAGFFDMLAEQHHHSSRDLVRKLHLDSAKFATDRTIQEFVDKRQDIVRVGLSKPRPSWVSTLSTRRSWRRTARSPSSTSSTGTRPPSRITSSPESRESTPPLLTTSSLLNVTCVSPIPLPLAPPTSSNASSASSQTSKPRSARHRASLARRSPHHADALQAGQRTQTRALRHLPIRLELLAPVRLVRRRLDRHGRPPLARASTAAKATPPVPTQATGTAFAPR